MAEGLTDDAQSGCPQIKQVLVTSGDLGLQAVGIGVVGFDVAIALPQRPGGQQRSCSRQVHALHSRLGHPDTGEQQGSDAGGNGEGGS